MPSRRRLLAAASALGASLAGCLGVGENPKFFNGYATDVEGSPFADDPAPANAPPFEARLFTSGDALDAALDWSAINDHYERQWKDIDFSRSFAAMFVTDRRLAGSGEWKGWCPLTRLEGGSLTADADTFVFDVTLERWPDRNWAEGEPPEMGVVFEQWLLRGNEPPKNVRVDVSLVGADGDERTCSD